MVQLTSLLILVSIIVSVVCAKLKLCTVDGRGGFKKSAKYCHLLDAIDSEVECVIGADRLDCLRRILKGKVDFSVFHAEDLVAAANSDIPILLTNELRVTDDDNQYKMVAIINNDSGIKNKHDLKDKKLCHPGYGSEADSNKILSNFLEISTVPQKCNPSVTLSENRISASSVFFKAACKAGPWVHNSDLDYELKQKYKNLCALCDVPSTCSESDKYWGRRGPLYCLTDGIGDVGWARLDDTQSHFGMVSGPAVSSPDGYSFLCPNGRVMPVNSTNPCVWVVKPWSVVASVRTRAEEVQNVVSSLKYDDKTPWKSALLSLIQHYHISIKKLNPIDGIESFFDRATGFLSANSFTGCHPPRTIKMCTITNLEYSKCGWLREAAAVYGIEPDVDCLKADNITHCMMALNDGFADIVMVPSNLVHYAKREYHMKTVFYETVEEVDKYITVAVIRNNSNIKNFEDLKGRKACFPEYDGVAWNSVVNKLREKRLLKKCPLDEGTFDFFNEICFGISKDLDNKKLTNFCSNQKYEGDMGALRCLNEGIGEIAFISKNYLEKYKRDNLNTNVRILCENESEPCHLSWSTVGQGMTSKNKTDLWIKDTLDVFLQFDNLFGKNYQSVTKSYSLFGLFDGKSNILFHDSTMKLKNVPKYKHMDKMSRNYDEILMNLDECNILSSSTSSIRFKLTLILINLMFICYLII